MSYSQLQDVPTNQPYIHASTSWPADPYPPWLQVLMQDTRFLTHIAFPETLDAPFSFHVSSQRAARSTTIRRARAPSASIRVRGDYGSASRRRYRASTRHATMSRKPLPASFYPQRVVSSSYPRVPYQSGPSPVHLQRKPGNWRRGYVPPSRGGLRRYISKIGSLIRHPSSPRLPYRLNPLLVYRPHNPVQVSYNLRFQPFPEYGLQFPALNRPPNPLDLFQLATSPPTFRMILWHRKLPWYVKIEASTLNGITVQDVLSGMYQSLRRPIGQHEYYTNALSSADREMLSVAFQQRCRGDAKEIAGGVRRVDFLGREVGFVGLARSRRGMWEIKTVEPLRPRMIIE
ncbi:unnamed protein product [Cyclocybe aegerita]|uniref:DUF6699 domain-containing protein n=1 Tax=Cyclocybe aegerita TaxID=1973307 RepID=A0A8S0WSP3_CYCAE|nr:unnamed protein product [Cyclocybe aegerita]